MYRTIYLLNVFFLITIQNVFTQEVYFRVGEGSAVTVDKETKLDIGGEVGVIEASGDNALSVKGILVTSVDINVEGLNADSGSIIISGNSGEFQKIYNPLKAKNFIINNPEGVVALQNVDVLNYFELNGNLQMGDAMTAYMHNSNPDSLIISEHNFISGKLKRTVSEGYNYDYPIGYDYLRYDITLTPEKMGNDSTVTIGFSDYQFPVTSPIYELWDHGSWDVTSDTANKYQVAIDVNPAYLNFIDEPYFFNEDGVLSYSEFRNDSLLIDGLSGLNRLSIGEINDEALGIYEADFTEEKLSILYVDQDHANMYLNVYSNYYVPEDCILEISSINGQNYGKYNLQITKGANKFTISKDEIPPAILILNIYSQSDRAVGKVQVY